METESQDQPVGEKMANSIMFSGKLLQYIFSKKIVRLPRGGLTLSVEQTGGGGSGGVGREEGELGWECKN